jgi:hypothetical protein
MLEEPVHNPEAYEPLQESLYVFMQAPPLHERGEGVERQHLYSVDPGQSPLTRDPPHFVVYELMHLPPPELHGWSVAAPGLQHLMLLPPGQRPV